MKMPGCDLPTVVQCALELRETGDILYWKYKLLELLLFYSSVTQIK
ncbi:unnamed protein product [Knipowitschia caucasica]